MQIIHIPCGEYANQSEQMAVERLRASLTGFGGNDRWILLSNVPHAVNTQAVPDDIDLIAIGPSGLHVIEIKYWDRAYAKGVTTTVAHEANKLVDKVRRIASKLKNAGIDAGYLRGKFLLTRGESSWPSNRLEVHGCEFFGIKEWKKLLDLDSGPTLSAGQVDEICKVLQPLAKVTLRGEVRSIGSARNLELISDRDDRFHRVFRGEHARTRDKIIFHLYDCSALDDPQSENLAYRQFETLQKLQRSSHVPRLLDSIQEVPQYPGELLFFSIVDPCAPSLELRSKDTRWDAAARAGFALKAAEALQDLHATNLKDVQFVHRNITPGTLLVGSGDQPIFTGFDVARISGSMTVSPSKTLSERQLAFAAPEVVDKGIGAADQRSDVFALCKTLLVAIADDSGDDSVELGCLLEQGLATDANDRPSLESLVKSLRKQLKPDALIAAPVTRETALPAQYWSDGDWVTFNGRQYRIASRIGSGSFGSTFKVVEVEDQQDVGVFAGKVMFDLKSGELALKAYRRIRSHTNHPNLATVFEVANQWEENRFVALMQWVDGNPLQSWLGLFELYAEELGEAPVDVAYRWLTSCCKALAVLHRAALVHGDVSPRNVLEQAGDTTLVDFDFVLEEGEPIWSNGTLAYAPPEHNIGQKACCGNDVYALAATMFHVVYEQEPFWFGGSRQPERGLNWECISRENWGWLPEFLDQATSPIKQDRFANAMAALKWIASRNVLPPSGQEPGTTEVTLVTNRPGTDSEPQLDGKLTQTSDSIQRTRQQVPWLANLLSTYPGSPRGCIETRGLDSDFANNTYVETSLERLLLDDIRNHRVQLVILCGNAGDGKTAFLQHVAASLGLAKQPSSERVATGEAFGASVMINLDGAASWRGTSSSELLANVFAPFHTAPSKKPRVHLVAVNDGRLLQWAEEHVTSAGRTPLTDWIVGTLLGDVVDLPSMPHVRLINLNERSLVGDGRKLPETPSERETWKPSTEFLDELLDRMLGGEQAAEIWAPCQTCSAASRCTAKKSVDTLRPQTDEGQEVARQIRARLAEAFQAVHQRGQVHITTRELRGALTYLFFGIHYCDDLHETPDLEPEHYWDRAFDAFSAMRQGDLLSELQRLDPAFGSNPAVDRYLRSRDPVIDPQKPSKFSDLNTVSSKRRRAYFEWLDAAGSLVARQSPAVPLFQSAHLDEFRQVAISTHEERRRWVERLCLGISRLEQLPKSVLRRTGAVPLKTMPRTPVETTFWVEKPLDRFTLEIDQSGATSSVEWLSNSLVLRYRYQNPAIPDETLQLGSDLFGLLLDLADGYQIMDSANDDVFTNLSIFTQRLAQEDERETFAWNPAYPTDAYRLSSRMNDGIQQIVFERVGTVLATIDGAR